MWEFVLTVTLDWALGIAFPFLDFDWDMLLCPQSILLRFLNFSFFLYVILDFFLLSIYLCLNADLIFSVSPWRDLFLSPTLPLFLLFLVTAFLLLPSLYKNNLFIFVIPAQLLALSYVFRFASCLPQPETPESLSISGWPQQLWRFWLAHAFLVAYATVL